VRIASNPTSVKHESVANYTDVTAGVQGRPVGAVTADVQQAVRGVDFPLEHHAEVLGDHAERQRTQGAVFAGSVSGAIAIFLLLQAAFTSWRLAALAFTTLPVALAGGLLAVFATGRTVTLGAVAGLLAVLGLTARHTVLLIRRYQRLQQEGVASGPPLVVRGTLERLMPILGTTLGTALLMVPFAFAGGAGLELIRPLAFTVIGGLITSTFVTLVMVPALYLRFGFGARADTAGDDLFVVLTIPEVEQATKSSGATA
jgi:Cu/Ag efflux pump CusA